MNGSLINNRLIAACIQRPLHLERYYSSRGNKDHGSVDGENGGRTEEGDDNFDATTILLVEAPVKYLFFESIETRSGDSFLLADRQSSILSLINREFSRG